MKEDKIVLKEHYGTWYIIDYYYEHNTKLYVLESEQHGDMALHVYLTEKEMQEVQKYNETSN
jgi:hypothetical protein